MMAHTLRASVAASITELKKQPMATIEVGEGEPVVIMNRNHPAFYCVPVDLFESLLERLEDYELAEIVKSHKDESRIRVSLDDL